MNDTPENTDPFRPARNLVLHGWTEHVDFAQNTEFVLQLLRHVQMLPCKCQLTHEILPKSRKKRSSPKNEAALLKVIEASGAFDAFHFTRPIDGNLINPELAVTFSIAVHHRYHMQKDADKFSVDATIEHIKLFCRLFTPIYGFSNIMPSYQALWFSSGGSTTTMDSTWTQRASALGYMLNPVDGSTPFEGKFHDIYELNILSKSHLERIVFDWPLKRWIAAGKRGALIEVKEGLAIWHVPDSIRDPIRQSFFNAGYLEVPI